MTILAAAVVAAGVTGGCGNLQKSGVDALEKGEYDEALADFQEMTESGGNDVAEGYRGLGMTYYEMEDYENALEAFRNAADNGAEQSIQMYNLMGVCAMQTEDYASALEYIQSGLALTGTSDGADKADEKLVQEMKYNEIICYEKLADWENARQKAEEYLGEYPEEFEYEGATYTPESFRDYLGINTADYVNLTSFTHHPFYTSFPIEVRDNWRWDSAYNLPIDEFMEVMYNAIDKGYTIAWGSDVSERGFTGSGVATVPDVDIKPGAGSDQERWVGKEKSDEKQVETTGEEKQITQEMRQTEFDNKLTTDDHGMHIYGLAQDQNGNKFFMVKNSWGDAGKYEGIWYVSDAFVRYKTLNIVVHKDALPKDIKKKLGIK